jgi:hypothetical protein
VVEWVKRIRRKRSWEERTTRASRKFQRRPEVEDWREWGVWERWGPKNLFRPISFKRKRKSTKMRKLRMLSTEMKRGFSSILKPLKMVMITIKRLKARSKT